MKKEYGIEIHFNITISSLNHFFDRYTDGNMEYLISVDFTNFNSILIIDMGYMFYECISLKSIDLSHFDTSKVTTWIQLICLILILVMLITQYLCFIIVIH